MIERDWSKVTREEAAAEVKLCHDPWYFFTNHVYTLDRHKGVKRFPHYPFLKDLVYLLHTERLLIILKSRQMLATWTVVCYSLWDSIMTLGSSTIFVSWRKQEVYEMISRAKFIYERLPSFLQPLIETDNKGEFSFKKRHSRLVGLPSVKKGIRSYTPSRVIMDETAFIDSAEMFYTSARPAVGDEGQIILLSSSNGVGNLFHRTFSSLSIDI